MRGPRGGDAPKNLSFGLHHGYIIRTGYQAANMAASQFGPVVTRGTAAENPIPVDRNTKRSAYKTADWTPATWNIVYNKYSDWIFWLWSFLKARKIPPKRVYSQLYVVVSYVLLCLTSYWLTDASWCITWVTEAWWELTLLSMPNGPHDEEVI